MSKLIQTQISEADLHDPLGWYILANEALERTINNESKKSIVITADFIATKALSRLNCENALPEDSRIALFEELRKMAADRLRQRWG